MFCLSTYYQNEEFKDIGMKKAHSMLWALYS